MGLEHEKMYKERKTLGVSFSIFKPELKGFFYSFHCLCPVAHVWISDCFKSSPESAGGKMGPQPLVNGPPNTDFLPQRTCYYLLCSESSMHPVQVLWLHLVEETEWDMFTPCYLVHPFYCQVVFQCIDYATTYLFILLLMVIFVVSSFCLLRIKLL